MKPMKILLIAGTSEKENQQLKGLYFKFNDYR